MDYKPIGGIAECSLHAADAASQSAAISVELIDSRSTYNQTLKAESGVCTVEHTLKLVACKKDAAAWLDSEFIRRASYEGVVAEVILNDNNSVRVGYSENRLNAQPLRLLSIEVDSGSSAEHIPTVILTLRSTDTSLNL